MPHFPDFLIQGKRLVELVQGFRIGTHVFTDNAQCGHAFRESIKLFALFPDLVGLFEVLHGEVKMFETGMQDAQAIFRLSPFVGRGLRCEGIQQLLLKEQALFIIGDFKRGFDGQGGEFFEVLSFFCMLDKGERMFDV